MTTLIFVRHGQSQTNIEQRFAGQFDTPLTDEGILQAKLLSDWVADNFGIDKIYSSSLRRAVDTAMVCSKKLGIPITTIEGLREIDGGSWHGKKYTDIMQEYPEEYHIWKTNIGASSLPQGESVEEFSKRVVAEVMHISELHPNQTIMIVAHAVVIRAVMAVFMMGDISKAAEISWVPNASVTVANYENALLNFETVGFDGYLKEHKSNLPSKLV